VFDELLNLFIAKLERFRVEWLAAARSHYATFAGESCYKASTCSGSVVKIAVH
jgi:hypothetical protein